MQTRELTKKEWQEVLSRFAVKPGEKTVRDFANEEGVGFNALTYRLYSCPEGAAARGKGKEVRVVPVDVSIRSGEEQEGLSLSRLRATVPMTGRSRGTCSTGPQRPPGRFPQYPPEAPPPGRCSDIVVAHEPLSCASKVQIDTHN